MKIDVPVPVEQLVRDPFAETRQMAVADPITALRHFVAGKDIRQLESSFLAMQQVDAPVVHTFGPGIYIREVSIPAGTIAIGHRQKHEHMNIMLKGRVTVVNEDGSLAELVAPMAFVGKPGRKIGYIHEDMVWQNIYATTETDVEKLEAMFLEKSDEWHREQDVRHRVQVIEHEVDRQDFAAAIAEYGFAPEVVQAQSEDSADQIEMPKGAYRIMVSDSPIHGKGVFATASFKAGEVIAPARIAGKRTPVGRYTNHSAKPNARMAWIASDTIGLVAAADISGCAGGELGEEITIDYRQALELLGVRRVSCQE
jgi:hypothetical protein